MRVLVPIEVLEGETVPSSLFDLLAPADVTLLGYHVLPEQTAPGQARQQFEERAVDALQDVAASYAGQGTIETRLVFTHDEHQTIDRVADEVGADAFVVPGAIGAVDSLLVPLTGDVAVDNVLEFVEALVAGRDVSVTLFLASEDTDGARQLLETSARRLREAGIDAATRLVTARPFEGLLAAVPGHDAVVMGEAAPSLRSFVLGDEAERIAAASVGPVVVVRRTVRQDGAWWRLGRAVQKPAEETGTSAVEETGTSAVEETGTPAVEETETSEAEETSNQGR